MKNYFPLIVALLFMALAAPAPAGAGPDMQEGLWEITSTVDMPGMPAAMPPVKHSQCITKNDLIPKPQSQQPNQQCTVTGSNISGNTVTWTMQCSSEGSDMEGSGNITYQGDSFDGAFIMNMAVPGQGAMKMTQKMKGKRLGPCK